MLWLRSFSREGIQGCAAVVQCHSMGEEPQVCPGNREPGMGAFPAGMGTAVMGKEQQHLPLL